MERTNKEYRLKISENYKTKIGTVNKKDPRVIYMINEGWVTPSGEDRKFTDEMKNVETKLKEKINDLVSNCTYLDKRFICNFSIKTERMKVDKASSLNIEIFFRQPETSPTMQLKELKDYMTNVAESITTTLNENFEILGYTAKPSR